MPDFRQSHAYDDNFSRAARFSEKDIEAAERLLRQIIACKSAADGDAAVLTSHSGSEPDGVDRIAGLAANMLELRSARQQHFNPAIFGEPGWDILLLLYVHDQCGQRYTTVKLAERIQTPLSSVIRWLGYLEKERMIERDPHPTDRRASFVRISEKAKRSIEEYFSKVCSKSSV